MSAPHTARGSTCTRTPASSAAGRSISLECRFETLPLSPAPCSTVPSRVSLTVRAPTKKRPGFKAGSDGRCRNDEPASVDAVRVRHRDGCPPHRKDSAAMAWPAIQGTITTPRRTSAGPLAASTETWLGFAGHHRRAWTQYVDFFDCSPRMRHTVRFTAAHDGPPGEYACPSLGSRTRSRPRMGSPS